MAASGITTAAAPAGGGLGRRQRQQAGEEEVVAAAMLRWRQERAVAAAKAAADEGLIQSVLQDATENRSRAPGRAGSEPSISVADGATGSAEAGPSRGGGASLQGRSRFLSFTTQSEENESVGGCSALAQDMVQQQRRQRDARTQLLQPHPRSPGGKRHHQGLGRRKRRSQLRRQKRRQQFAGRFLRTWKKTVPGRKRAENARNRPKISGNEISR